MKKRYPVTNLFGMLALGEKPEREPSPAEYGHFDENRYFIIDDESWSGFLYPWEWIYIDEIKKYAIECGVELPDGTIDFGKTF